MKFIQLNVDPEEFEHCFKVAEAHCTREGVRMTGAELAELIAHERADARSAKTKLKELA